MIHFVLFVLTSVNILIELKCACSSVAAALAKFLGSHVRDLNAADIGLGPLGFQILEEALPTEVALSHINIR